MHASVSINGNDVTNNLLTKLNTATLSPINLPGGGTFTPSTAIPVYIGDVNGLPIPNTEAWWGS